MRVRTVRRVVPPRVRVVEAYVFEERVVRPLRRSIQDRSGASGTRSPPSRPREARQGTPVKKSCTSDFATGRIRPLCWEVDELFLPDASQYAPGASERLSSFPLLGYISL